MCIPAITLLAALALPIQLAAQHTRYRLIDIGTLGGPSAHGPGNGPGSQFLNNAGMVAGTAETTSTDPNAPNCDNPDCASEIIIRECRRSTRVRLKVAL